jgi:hypothetical protein
METPAVIRQMTGAEEKLFPDALDLLNRTERRNLFAPDYLFSNTKTPMAGYSVL